MNDVVKLKAIPEPIPYKGRERLVSGWNTAAVAKWLIEKKIKDRFATLSEVAVFAYGRDSGTNRQRVKHNINSLRHYTANLNEFLLVRYGYRHRVDAVKVCNAADESDRQIASEQLSSLEARGEVTLFEADRWRKMLFLPTG